MKYGLPITRGKVTDIPVRILLLKPRGIWQQIIKSQLSYLKTSQEFYYILNIGWREWTMRISMRINIKIKAKIYTMMNKIHTNITSRNMKESMQKNIVNEAE